MHIYWYHLISVFGLYKKDAAATNIPANQQKMSGWPCSPWSQPNDQARLRGNVGNHLDVMSWCGRISFRMCWRQLPKSEQDGKAISCRGPAADFPRIFALSWDLQALRMTWNAEPHKIVPEELPSPPRNNAFSSLNIGGAWPSPFKTTDRALVIFPPRLHAISCEVGIFSSSWTADGRHGWHGWHGPQSMSDPKTEHPKSSSMSSRSPSISFKGRCWSALPAYPPIPIFAMVLDHTCSSKFPGGPFANLASPKKNKRFKRWRLLLQQVVVSHQEWYQKWLCESCGLCLVFQGKSGVGGPQNA